MNNEHTLKMLKSLQKEKETFLERFTFFNEPLLYSDS